MPPETAPPPGLNCTSVPAAPHGLRAAVRRFCLATIKDVYGTDYRADWHSDLDLLADEGAASWFGAHDRGAFWALTTARGEIVATAGLYRLARKPALAAAFSARYPDPGNVAQLVRVYVGESHRGKRLGCWLSAFAESEARRLGFGTLYLHASSDRAEAIRFWQGSGFTAFASGDGTTHFDKALRDVQSGMPDAGSSDRGCEPQ